MADIIQIQQLSKHYGHRPAVDQLDLTVAEGELFGFVGPNGAGKTTTIRIMATLLEPNAGDILVAGNSVRRSPRQVRRVIGYMPDFFGVYNDMLVWEYLDFFGSCYQLPSRQRTVVIKDLLELVDLSHRHNDPVESLSRGMKQRLSLARTLIHDPQVLILDEPASGLDPRARIEIRELLVELARMGKTVFFSTHILADVAQICTRVGIIEAGKLVAVGNLEDLQQHLVPHRQIEVTLLKYSDRVVGLLQGIPGIVNVNEAVENNHHGSQRIGIEFQGDDQALSSILEILIKEGNQVVNFAEERRDLEEVFMRATRGIVS